jgi:hypothetical protein
MMSPSSGHEELDLEDERERFARDMAAAATALVRLADLSMVLETDTPALSASELNDFADRLFSWAVSVGTNLFRPALVDHLDKQQVAFEKWRDLRSSVRDESRQRRGHEMEDS